VAAVRAERAFDGIKCVLMAARGSGQRRIKGGARRPIIRKLISLIESCIIQQTLSSPAFECDQCPHAAILAFARISEMLYCSPEPE
jgi:hypothetical protein